MYDVRALFTLLTNDKPGPTYSLRLRATERGHARSSGNVACREERATRVETPLFMVTTAIRLHPGLSQKTNVRAKRVLGRPIADGY